MNNLLTIISFLLILLKVTNVLTSAIELTESNLDSILYSNEIVFVNFYANWCRFSQILSPIFDQLADRIAKEYSNDGFIKVGKVNCDSNVAIAKNYQIKKYPTLKLFRNGLITKREYRGSRDVNSLFEYLKTQIQSPIIQFNDSTGLAKLDGKFDFVIGHFQSQHSKSFEIFSKVASLLRDQCSFAASINNAEFLKENAGNEFVYYRSNELLNQTEFYNESMDNEQMFYIWSNKNCDKLIREIRFDNAEELIDEGLPFLILFHRINDHKSIELFEQQVQKQLLHHRSTINCLRADGPKFSHPLRHLGKTIDDLPLLVIDTFQHMFLFEDFGQISINGKLLKFVEDLLSGKLHEDFHNKNAEKKSTVSLSESVFVRLSPSRQRYSFRDEL